VTLLIDSEPICDVEVRIRKSGEIDLVFDAPRDIRILCSEKLSQGYREAVDDSTHAVEKGVRQDAEPHESRHARRTH
jgi:hypothetical protein